jgi:hypothetical protein
LHPGGNFLHPNLLGGDFAAARAIEMNCFQRADD